MNFINNLTDSDILVGVQIHYVLWAGGWGGGCWEGVTYEPLMLGPGVCKTKIPYVPWGEEVLGGDDFSTFDVQSKSARTPNFPFPVGVGRGRQTSQLLMLSPKPKTNIPFFQKRRVGSYMLWLCDTSGDMLGYTSKIWQHFLASEVGTYPLPLPPHPEQMVRGGFNLRRLNHPEG